MSMSPQIWRITVHPCYTPIDETQSLEQARNTYIDFYTVKVCRPNDLIEFNGKLYKIVSVVPVITY